MMDACARKGYKARMDGLLATLRQRCDDFLKPSDGVLIACSGGPDSQCLLDLFGRLHKDMPSRRLLAVGINHGLRSEAGEELDLAEQLAQSHDIPFLRRTVNVSKNGNLMANARRARYQALRDIAQAHSISIIALGHTATDQAETVLFQLARGTGSHGASGMSILRGNRFRPLLGFTREEILNYVRRQQLPTAVDPSNADPTFTRIALRQNVLPYLEAAIPQAVKNIGFSSQLLQEDDRFLEAQSAAALQEARSLLGSLRLTTIRALPSPILRRVLRQWARNNQFDLTRDLQQRLVAALREGKPWKTSATRDRNLSISGGRLWCEKPINGYCTPFATSHAVTIPGLGFKIESTLHDRSQNPLSLEDLKKKGTAVVAFDADQLHLELKMRSWKTNDRLQPFGSTGHSTLGDLFTNAKIPLPLRNHWPLIVKGDEPNEILWVPGIKRGNKAVVTQSTKRYLMLELTHPIWPPAEINDKQYGIGNQSPNALEGNRQQ